MGDYLYIQGGTALLPKKDYENIGIENRTFAISLTKSWTKSSIDMNTVGQVNDAYREIATSDMAVWTRPDNKQLLFWGGYSETAGGNQGSKNASIRTYTPDSSGKNGKWDSGPSYPIDTLSKERIYRTWGGSWTQCNGYGFHLGGIVDRTSDSSFTSDDKQQALSGLVIYDLVAGTWRNRSSEGFGEGRSAGKSIMGSAACMPTLGTDGKGIVVFVGGSNTDRVDSSWKDSKNLLPTEKITFYDIGSDKFYTQKASGDIPTPRFGACVVAAKAKDSRTYEIVFYGGSNTKPAQTHILTIPGFEWFSVKDATGGAEGGRQSHACTIIGKGARQMLAFGGRPEGNTFDNFSTLKTVRDPWGENSLQIFDLTKLEWKESYDHDAPEYQQPTMNNDNRALFADIIDNPLSEDSLPTNDPPRKPPLAAIVGGAVGGALVLILVAGSLLYLCWYKPRRHGAEPCHQIMQQPMSDSNENQSDQGTSIVPQAWAQESNLYSDGQGLSSPTSPPSPHVNEGPTSHTGGPSHVAQELPAGSGPHIT
ncbi:hypothetical protein PspLS_00124 [Pyricularia sp. CBS 133598]|nr:hypothetical protein PspLS_00124 [Pyricularia sp. CBS 133598]